MTTRKAGTDRAATAERRAKFVAAYLVNLNATQAAIEAGFSPKTARSMASQLLTRIDVTEAIARAKVTALAKVNISQDRVLSELTELAFSSVANYRVDEQGDLRPAEGKPESVMAAVASVRRKVRAYPDGSKEFEVYFTLHDKPGSLKLAGRHVGLFPQKDQAAIEAAAEVYVNKLVERARQQKAQQLAEQENREAERQRAIDVGEVPPKADGAP